MYPGSSRVASFGSWRSGGLLNRHQSLEECLADEVDVLQVINLVEADGDDTVGEGEGSTGDDSESLPSVQARTFVFAFFSLGVQMFMSYGGGAVPTSLPKIERELPRMSNSQVGLLGSLDKIALMAISPLVGWAMQRCDQKLLLVFGLALNAFFTFCFGFLQNLYAMLLARFMQGVSEAQQIVWGSLWTRYMAPPWLLPVWMNLGGVAAGAGNGLGIAVAGYSDTYPYSFPFTVQAAVLAFLCVIMLFTPGYLLKLPKTDSSDTSADAKSVGMAGREAVPMRTRDQLRHLLGNRLYLCTMFCIAQNSFMSSGISFFWTNFFYSDMWNLDMKAVTTSNLAINAVGLVLGIVLGPILVNSCGDYTTPEGRYVTLRLLVKVTAFGALGATISFFGILMQALSKDDQLGIPWLWVVWLGTVPLNFALSAQCGVQVVINIGSVPRNMQEFALGITTSMQHVIGSAGGVFIPSVVMDIVWYIWLWFHDFEINDAHLQAIGFMTVMGMSFILLGTVTLTQNAAYAKWNKEHEAVNTWSE